MSSTMSSTGEVLSSGEERMQKALDNLQKEFQTVRTGRANPAILDRVEVDYYGTPTPLKSLANISSPDGRSLLVQPYDKGAVKDIEQGIHKAQLGLTPTNDGSVVRINIPALTEDRRKELCKQVKKIGEEAKVAVRNIRRDCDQELKKFKDQGVSEDELKRRNDDLQKMTDKYVKEIDTSVTDKDKEIMEI
ncbi:MAG: ribosome recycling factor [Cyanobacteriota/Melainabacteria group bacterium]